MDPRILAATGHWRRREQLRGLQPNHSGTVRLEVAPLAKEGTLFDACSMTLHPSEGAMAVGMAPFLAAGPSSVGIVALSSATATGSEAVGGGFSLAPPGNTAGDEGSSGNIVGNSDFANAVRWLDLPHNAPLASVEWLGGRAGSASALLMGTTRGRILVAHQTAAADAIADMPHQSSVSVVNTLLVGSSQPPVASCAVQPTNFAATTTVRCIRRCPVAMGASLVAGASGAGVYVWDVASGASAPILSIPLASPADDTPETAVCCAWGMSSSVVAVGGVAGTAFLVDKRQGPHAALTLPAPSEFPVRSIDLSMVVPSAVLIASSKGVLTIADARKPSQAVLTLDALQEAPVCAAWMPHHPDLFASGGMDGTVKLWSLRSRPNYVVGCAQFPAVVAHAIIPRTYADTRVLGLTADGHLCTAALTRSAMMAIAPNGLRRDDAYIAAQKGLAVTTPSEDARAEQRAEGLLYCRAYRPLMKAVLAAAKRREQRGDLDFALRVCSLVDSKAVPSGMDLGTICEQGASVSLALGALGVAAPSEGPPTLLQDIVSLAQRLPSTVVMASLKGFEAPDSDDPTRVEALKLNITMRKLLNAREAALVSGGAATMLAFLGRRPDLVETDVLVATTRFLLQSSRRDGTAFVNKALDSLSALSARSGGGLEAGGGAAGLVPQRCSHLTRALLLTVSEPLITENTSVNPKRIRKIHRTFLGDLTIAKRAVEAQLHVCDIDMRCGGALAAAEGTMRGVPVGSPAVQQAAKAIVAYVAKYQSEALESESALSMGVFTWLGARPIMAYLRSLIICDSTVAFLWTAQQFLDAYAQHGSGSSRAPVGAAPILKSVSDLAEELLAGIAEEGRELIDDATTLSEADEMSVRVLAEAEDLLADMHPFLLRVLRLAIESSNVALSSDLPDVPPLVKGIVEDLSQAAGDCCDSWVVLLSALCKSRLRERVATGCGPLLAEFGEAVAALRDDVALDNTCEHVMDSIVTACDSFADTMAAAAPGKKGGGGRRR